VTPQAVRDQNPGRALSKASIASLITFSVDNYTFLPAGLFMGGVAIHWAPGGIALKLSF
jgi:hypothetical protein